MHMQEHIQRRTISVTMFTLEEEEKFATRYKNGYDLHHDARYNEWLRLRHPEKARSAYHESSLSATFDAHSPIHPKLPSCQEKKGNE